MSKGLAETLGLVVVMTALSPACSELKKRALGKERHANTNDLWILDNDLEQAT